MSDLLKNSQNHSNQDFNPLMIQSYFDNELTSEEFAAISHDDLIHSPTYLALSELRQVVRTESELALDDIDGYALLDAINAQIDADPRQSVQSIHPIKTEKQEDVSPFTPKRRTTAQVFRRWAPAFVGAALFLLSIPGFVNMFTPKPLSETQTPTVVVIDGNRNAQAAQAVVNYPSNTQHVWYENNTPPNAQIPAQTNITSPDEQLTIEEMDFALRHLINRIETLEKAHTDGLETGRKALFLNQLANENESPKTQDSDL